MIKPRILFMVFLMVLAGLSLMPRWGSSASLYKRYIVKKDRGAHILCRAHIAGESDSMAGFFTQRGDLGVAGFNEYAGIFLRINPHIRDVDRLDRGLRLFVPLRKIAPDTFPGQSTGIVDIPYIGISSIPELLKKYSNTHVVERGDYLSGLIQERFGGLGPGYYEAALAIFRKINPGVKDPDRIYAGDRILLPDPSILNQAWFASLFDRGGNIIAEAPVEGAYTRQAGMHRAAQLLGAELLDRGIYHFPMMGGGELSVDLSAFPVLREKGGRRVILVGAGGLSLSDLDLIRTYWKDLLAVPVTRNPTAGEILKAIRQGESGIDPENPRTFVRELFKGMGLPYTPAAGISFPYSGVQVKALANLVSAGEGRELIVDFGDLYGDAVSAIEKSGVRVVSLKRGDDRSEIVRKLMGALDYSYVENPAFSPLPGEVSSTVIKGLYVKRSETRKLFVADGVPDDNAVSLLKKLGIELVLGKFQ